MFPMHDGYLREFCLPVLSLCFASSLRVVSLFFPLALLMHYFCSSCSLLVLFLWFPRDYIVRIWGLKVTRIYGHGPDLPFPDPGRLLLSAPLWPWSWIALCVCPGRCLPMSVNLKAQGSATKALWSCREAQTKQWNRIETATCTYLLLNIYTHIMHIYRCKYSMGVTLRPCRLVLA